MMFKTLFKTTHNLDKHLRQIIWRFRNSIHISIIIETQNKLAACYKTVANSILKSYWIASPVKVTNFADYKHNVNNSNKCTDIQVFVMFIK